MRRWDRLFFVNRRRMQNFIAAGAIDATSDAPRLIGMPKADCLVDGSLDRRAVLQELGLSAARPTVLYAPTWSGKSSLNVMGSALVEGLLKRQWNVIVKLHDRSLERDVFTRFDCSIAIAGGIPRMSSTRGLSMRSRNCRM